MYELEEEMPLSELEEWSIFFRMKREQEEKARKQAEQKAKLNTRRR